MAGDSSSYQDETILERIARQRGISSSTAILLCVLLVSVTLRIVITITQKIRQWLNYLSYETSSLPPMNVKVYTLRDMELATLEFDKRRIRGTSEDTFKGMLKNGTEVVVKKAKFVNRSERKRFISEIDKLSRVSHKNILPVLGVCLQSNRPCLVYKHISSRNLGEFIEQSRTQPTRSWEESRNILRDIADAIHHLHLLGLYHWNIKLENILVDDHKNMAYLTDFGFSEAELANHTLDLTCTETSDVYSFGLVTAQVLGGICVSGKGPTTEFIHKFVASVKNDNMSGLDPKLVDDKNMEEVWRYAVMACACLRQFQEQNIEMEVVSNVLWGRIQVPPTYQIEGQFGQA